MLKKGFKDMMAEANAVIDVVSVHDAVARYGDPEVIFIDVREGSEVQKARIPGAVHVPRGFLEFMADPCQRLPFSVRVGHGIPDGQRGG